jgi:membrane peptidoglycan carboxypeptidase
MTLTDAIARSNNCAFTRTIMSLGPGGAQSSEAGNAGAERVKEMAAKLGINPEPLKPVPSMTLGTSDTNVMDMAEAFATFAHDGVHRRPMFVTRIEGPDGTVLYEADQTGDRVLEPEVARTQTSMLTEVVKRGTGTRADIGRPVAGKTGTTDKNTDAWFVGYTPQFTAAVWMGYPEAGKSMNEDLPVVEFIAPDEQRWGTAQRITEHGRIFSRDFVGADDTTTTLVPPDVTTVVPPPAATTVPAPVTTTPPATSAPPPTAPPPPPQQNLPNA